MTTAAGGSKRGGRVGWWWWLEGMEAGRVGWEGGDASTRSESLRGAGLLGAWRGESEPQRSSSLRCGYQSRLQKNVVPHRRESGSARTRGQDARFRRRSIRGRSTPDGDGGGESSHYGSPSVALQHPLGGGLSLDAWQAQWAVRLVGGLLPTPPLRLGGRHPNHLMACNDYVNHFYYGCNSKLFLTSMPAF